MEFFFVAIACVAAGAAGALAAARLQRRSWLARTVTSRVIVHTTEDQSIEGLLVQAGPDGVLLEAPRMTAPEEVDLAGAMWIPGPKVNFIQKVAS